MNPNSHKSDPQKIRHQPSNSELLSSAKYLAVAAQSSLHHESSKIDKGRVAGAAADLLDAASRQAKLEEKSYGQYVEKAENYLHQYHSSHKTTTTTTTTTTSNSGHSTTTTHSTSHSSDGGGDGKSGSGGYGDYLKMAEGFLKKH